MATAILMPRQGQSVESCILVEWRVAPGDTVKVGTPLAAIETDKAVFEVESTADGTVLALFAKPGDDVPVLATIAAVGEPGEDVRTLTPAGTEIATPASASAPAPAAPLAATPANATTASGATHATGVSPRARHRATAAGIDPATLTGSGPNGRVIERDVRAAEATAPRLSPAAREAIATGRGTAPARGTGPGGMVLAADIGHAVTASTSAAATPAADTIQEIPLTGIRKIIADRMRQSLASTAQLTLTRSFDATAILDYRRQIKDEGQTFGLPNITINDMIAFATARTLRRHSTLNGHVADGRITRHSAVHLGVATDTPRGLMVPVLRNAHALTLPDFSRQLKPLLEAAQSGTINPDLLRGGTFTITNMGMLGVETFTPILNAPEVAILGIGGLVWKPVEHNGAIRHVQSITLSLTIDHQAVDGAPGARFLQDLANALQNFALTLTASV